MIFLVAMVLITSIAAHAAATYPIRGGILTNSATELKVM